MKYYKCICGNGWGNHFKENEIYKESVATKGGVTLKYIKERGYYKEDFEEVSYADYLKQEYDAGRITKVDLYRALYNTALGYNEFISIISNNKANNMEELKLEKNKVIETYNNRCSEVKKTLEELFGKETFKSYRLGNIFELNSPAYYYILTQVDEKRINLIGLNSGNRYEDSIEVEDIYNITSKDLIRLDEDFFTKFKFVANNYKDLK